MHERNLWIIFKFEKIGPPCEERGKGRRFQKGTGEFLKNLVKFRDPELPDFSRAQKMRLKIFSSWMQLKRSQVWIDVSKTHNCGKVHRIVIDRHRPTIGSSPNTLEFKYS